MCVQTLKIHKTKTPGNVTEVGFALSYSGDHLQLIGQIIRCCILPEDGFVQRHLTVHFELLFSPSPNKNLLIQKISCNFLTYSNPSLFIFQKFQSQRLTMITLYFDNNWKRMMLKNIRDFLTKCKHLSQFGYI